MNIYVTVSMIRDMAVHARGAINSEEATKTSLVLPMLSALGYDIFDPYQLIPEMDCDLTKSGDKIDYAIAIDHEVRILIECKHHNVNLSLHSAQLKKYFAASEARCGVLTNGIEYLFFSDTAKANIMDDSPFFRFDIMNHSNEDIDTLSMFSKDTFSNSRIEEYIKDVEVRKKVTSAYRTEVTKMSDKFISMILSSANVEDTENNRKRCREILAKETGTLQKDETTSSNNSILSAVKDVSSSEIDNSRVFSVKYKEHEVVFMDNQSKWICRVYPAKGIIIFPPGDSNSTMDYSGVASISKYSKEIISVIKSY